MHLISEEQIFVVALIFFINLLQTKLIKDLIISARKIGLDVSLSAFNRITERDLRWHPYKMYIGKEGNNYKLS